MGSAHPPPMKGNEQSVASTEIVRNFSVWQNRSADRPVYILHHGRPRSVLLSLDQYSELAAGLGSQDEREERLRTHIDILLARMNMMFVQLGRDLRIVRANRAAANWLGRSVADMAEQALEAIFPVANAQRIADISRKVSDTGIGQRLKMQSHITADLHYCLDVVPFPPGVALFWADVMQETGLAAWDAWRNAGNQLLAMMTGCAVGEVGPDGLLTEVHPSLTRLLRRHADIVSGTAFTVLFDPGSRRKCQLHLEHVLSGEGPARCRADLLTRDRGAVRIRLFLAPKIADGGVEGVIFSILDDSLGALPMR